MSKRQCLLLLKKGLQTELINYISYTGNRTLNIGMFADEYFNEGEMQDDYISYMSSYAMLENDIVKDLS